MKKTILFLTFLPLLIVVYLFSCQKSDDLTKETAATTGKNESIPGHNGDEVITTRSDNEYDYSDCPYQLGLVTKSNGRLVFQNEEHFEKCALCLEYQYGVHNDAFDAQYLNATAEQLDSLAALTNFNEWYPYVQFEASLNFSSLRAKVKTESETFLAGTPADSIDLNQDPDALSPVFRTSERALLNEDGETMVGGQLKTKDDWAEKFWDDCGFLLSRQHFFTESDNPVLVNRKVRLTIAVQSGLLLSKLYGKIRYYKKDNNGNFRSNVRADLYVSVHGSVFDGDCVAMLHSQDWNKYDGWKKRTNLEVTAHSDWLLWREAMVESTNPMWPVERSFVNGYLFTGNNFFTWSLAR